MQGAENLGKDDLNSFDLTVTTLLRRITLAGLWSPSLSVRRLLFLPVPTLTHAPHFPPYQMPPRYRSPPSFQSSIYAALLLRRTHVSACFPHQKESKEGIHFYRKGGKVTTVSARVRQQRSQGPFAPWAAEAGERGAARLLPGSHAQHLGTKAPQLSTVAELLRFSSVYFVHPSARCVLWSLLLRFTPFRPMKGFTGTLYFQTLGETHTYGPPASLQPTRPLSAWPFQLWKDHLAPPSAAYMLQWPMREEADRQTKGSSSEWGLTTDIGRGPGPFNFWDAWCNKKCRNT